MRHNKRNLDDLLDRHLSLYKASSGKQPEASQETPAPGRRRRNYLIAAAAALLAIAVVFIGRSLPEGKAVRTGADAGAVLSLADGSRVEMRSNSELSLERAEDGERIRLLKGGVIVNAAKQRTGHLYVQTKDVTVSVVGTVFLVNAEEKGSRVAVIEGEVRVQLRVEQGGTSKKLLPGEQVATNPAMESQPVSKEISWSRNAEAHLALLQQSVPPQQPPAQQPAGDVFEVATVRPVSPDGGGRGGAGGISFLPSGCERRYPFQIDPRRFATSGATLYALITWAYGTGKMNYETCRKMNALNLISGGPAWIRSDEWDVQAIIPEGEAAQLRKMLQTLLADRFKLVIRSETKEVPAYILTAEKGAPRTSVRSEIDTPQFREMRANQAAGIIVERGAILVKNAPIADLIPILEQDVGRPILDQTGLTGQYSFVVEYTPLYRIQNGGTPFAGPAIFAALPEQVGLKLEPAKTTLEHWIVERAEKPGEQ